MTSSKMILACIDGSSITQHVIDHAIFLAKSTQSALTFLNIIEHSAMNKNVAHQGAMTPNMSEHLLESLTEQERDHVKKLISDGKSVLENAKNSATNSGLSEVFIKQVHGQLVKSIDQFDQHFEFVVLGAKGESSEAKERLGSQLEETIRASHTPTYVVKSEFKQPKSMLFAYNGSPESRQAMRILTDQQLFSSDVVIHIVAIQKDRKLAQMLVNEAMAALEHSHYTTIKSDVLITTNPDQLLRYQIEYNVDTTMMAAFRHSKIHGFLFGSFTNKMLLESKANFILIR